MLLVHPQLQHLFLPAEDFIDDITWLEQFAHDEFVADHLPGDGRANLSQLDARLDAPHGLLQRRELLVQRLPFRRIHVAVPVQQFIVDSEVLALQGFQADLAEFAAQVDVLLLPP